MAARLSNGQGDWVCMDNLLKDLEMRAATIDELLSSRFSPLRGEKKDAHKAAVRLSAWCRASASGDWQLFARRLARDGLSLESVLSCFLTWTTRGQKATREPSTSEHIGPTSSREFEQFVSHMRETGLGHLFAAKPVLLRLLALT